MSYCRWSSNNYRCDVYVYEYVHGGYMTHVAGRRHVIPPIPDLPMRWRWKPRNARIWNLWHKVSMWSVDLIPRRAIDLPHDGQSFCDPTPGECADRLESLRTLGYLVPQFAIDALRAEEEEEAKAGGAA